MSKLKTTAGKTAKSIFLLAMAILSFSACKKEGPAGPAGKDGKDGNANVVSSVVTTSSANWSYISPSWISTFTYPAITQDIIDKGAVLVYLKTNTNAYNQLPLTFYPTASYSRTYEVSTTVGGFGVYCTDSDLTQPANPNVQTFKVVVIAASGLKAHPNVNLNNYEEVKATFNLND